MTDTPPLTDDELSAVLDGEAPAEVVARAEADPRARARLAELRSAAEAVAAPVPPLSGDVVDRLVARALDAGAGIDGGRDEPADRRADEAVAAGPGTPGDAGPDPDAEAAPDVVVAPLAPRRGRRAAAPPWLVAAVVVALVAVGLGLVWSGRSSDQRTSAGGSASTKFNKVGAEIDRAPSSTTLAAPAQADSAGSSDPLAGHGATTVPPGPTASIATQVEDLGTFASTTELRQALRSSFPASDKTFRSSSSSSPSSGAVTRCAEQVQITLALDAPPTARGVATVRGRRLLVYEFAAASYADGSATTLVAAVGVDACDPVLTFER